MQEETGGFPITAAREISILLKAKHRNTVQLREVVVGLKPDSIFLVFEYCETDLHRVNQGLALRNSRIPLKDVKCLAVQILNSLYFSHKNHIIHRDIKLNNILLNKKGEVKLADFGLARIFGNDSTKLTPKVCTLWNRSPEILLKCGTYSVSADMW